MPEPDLTPSPPARSQVALAAYTTLGLGGPAATLVEPRTDVGLAAAVGSADQSAQPVLVLGGGSNVVVADEGFPGTVVRVATRGIAIMPSVAPAPPGPSGPGGPSGSEAAVTMTVAAGEDWDRVVAQAVGEELAGLECLSGIPGLAGATPIQNVGAYGQEVADTITGVRVYDRQTRQTIDLPAGACGFGYRTSAFKRTPFSPGAATGRFVVLSVTFRLARSPISAPIRYPELASALGVAPGDRVPLAEARSAVLKLRARKGMVLDAGDPDSRSAGSFFTNPILSAAELLAVEETARRIEGPDARVPRFPAGRDQAGQELVKVPAAWLIEHAGYGKGYRGPGAPGAGSAPAGAAARISSKHTLALINPGGASTASLLALAAEIRDGVRARFGVTLVIEPVLVGVTV